MPERSETKSPAEVCKRTYGTGQKVKKKKKKFVFTLHQKTFIMEEALNNEVEAKFVQ